MQRHVLDYEAATSVGGFTTRGEDVTAEVEKHGIIISSDDRYTVFSKYRDTGTPRCEI